MTTPSAPVAAPRFQMTKSVVFIAFFMTMIWLPLLDSYFHLDRTLHPDEKRTLALFPDLKPGTKEVREFLSGLDKYYSDHFGFRNWLVRRQNRWRRKWFHESSVRNVVQGREGWYFFAGDKMIEHATGQARFNDARLHAWRDLLETRRNWLAERGIAYLFVVAPDKHTVYSEYLPDWIKSANATTKMSQFLAYMRANSTVPVLDLRPSLIEKKKTARVYKYTDTHWTSEGGFVTYQQLAHALEAQLPGIEPLDTNQFKRSYATKPGGDLATLLGEEQLVEKDSVRLTPVPPLKGLTVTVNTELYPKEWQKKTEPRITENPDARGTAIVFRDSFAGSWTQFLGVHFNRVIYIWQYYWNPEFIESAKPHVVIDEILERFLNKEDPVMLKVEDGLNRAYNGPGSASRR